MVDSVAEAVAIGQAMWLDYIRRGMLASGELQQYIDQGISGVTSNPTIFEKAIVGSTDYDAALLELASANVGLKQSYEALAVHDIRAAANVLRPVYDRTGGLHGYVSLEVSPKLAYDTEATIVEARRLFAALGRPNVFIKVPATQEGMPAIRRLISEGINVNVTLIFSLDMYRQAREAYLAGLEDRASAGAGLGGVASVASFFLSRVDTAVDRLLEARIRNGEEGSRELLGRAAVSNGKLAYQAFKAAFGGERFAYLKSKGARVQRPLWASTGAKNPAYSDLHYVEPLIGPDTINTMPPATFAAFREHGRAEAAVERDVLDAERTLEGLATVGISMEAVTGKLLADGVKAFADSFDKLLAGMEQKMARLLAAKRVHMGVGLGRNLPEVQESLTRLERDAVCGRIWQRDYSVWKPDPAEITNRLGWLAATETMEEQVPDLEEFAAEVRDARFRHVVLLGMGGSSLGPEVLRQVFGSAAGYPDLVVLDSVVPAAVKAVADAIDPSRTLFLVSSKSGSTLEPLVLMKYFKSLLAASAGDDQVGRHFAAITDAGTPLARLAAEEGFRRTFLNRPDIGGRYSVLSFFGMVPAALMGIDITALFDRADGMREGCAPCVPAHENPGAWLGAAMGTLALSGRDKLTLLTSPGISASGLWVEQLIAESTGKEGKGIVPVAGEPLLEAARYGDDRLFVYLRLEGDDNSATDVLVEEVKSLGHPVLLLEMRDRYDLGAEFFLWEFATAVAGAILGINPFDQPDVQAAKDATERVLCDYRARGRLPRAETEQTLPELLADARSGSYLAIMAYLRQTPGLDAVLARLRHAVAERHGIATTLGYGPRFLHSTGQLHKGGPDTGIFFQITAENVEDLPIPDEPYTFGVVADAQALGDFEALQSRGRKVSVARLGGGDIAWQVSEQLARVAVSS